MHRGYIRIWRKLRDNPYMKKPAYRSVWLELLFEATHKRKKIIWKGRQLVLKPGQLTCGEKQLAEWTGVPQGTVRRILEALKNEDQIERQTSNQFSLITIKNWNEYQQSEEQNEERVKNERRTSEERMKTPKECNNVKNEKNVEEETPAEKIFRKLRLKNKDLLGEIEDMLQTYPNKDLYSVALKVIAKHPLKPPDQIWFLFVQWTAREFEIEKPIESEPIIF